MRIVVDEQANLRLMWFAPGSARGGFLPHYEEQGARPGASAEEKSPYTLLIPELPGGYPRPAERDMPY